MPTFSSALYTQQLHAQKGFGGRASGLNVTSQLMFLVSTYTTTGTEVANDLINVGLLPAGVVVVPDMCRVSTDGIGGTGATVATLGDALDDDRYSATAVAVVSAGSSLFTGVNAQLVAPVAVPEGGEIIRAKIGLSSGSITAARRLTFTIAYRSTV
jgi:hypothetical protein